MRELKKNLMIVAALAAAFAAPAMGSQLARMYQDIRLPTQVVLEHKSWAIPLLAAVNYVKTSGALSGGASGTTMTTFTHQPDYPRNLTITPTASTAQVGACTVVVTGKNIFGATITENFAISSTQSTATTGNAAFGSVSSIVFPAACMTTPYQATWEVGIGSKLGVHRCADDAGKYVFSEFGGAYETTRGTFANDTTHVELNTFIPNGTMDGATAVDEYFIQNYRCNP